MDNNNSNSASSQIPSSSSSNTNGSSLHSAPAPASVISSSAAPTDAAVANNNNDNAAATTAASSVGVAPTNHSGASAPPVPTANGNHNASTSVNPQTSIAPVAAAPPSSVGAASASATAGQPKQHPPPSTLPLASGGGIRHSVMAPPAAAAAPAGSTQQQPSQQQSSNTQAAPAPDAPLTQQQKLQRLYAQQREQQAAHLAQRKLQQQQQQQQQAQAAAAAPASAAPLAATATTAPQHAPAPVAAPNRSWTVPNPLSAIPAAPQGNTNSGSGAAPNPLASLAAGHASTNHSRVALAAVAGGSSSPRPQQQQQQPIQAVPQQQQQQQPATNAGVPHPLAQQQAQVRALQQRALQQKQQQQLKEQQIGLQNQQERQRLREEREQRQQQQQQQRAQQQQQQQQEHLRQQQAQVRALQHQHQQHANQQQQQHHAYPQQQQQQQHVQPQQRFPQVHHQQPHQQQQPQHPSQQIQRQQQQQQQRQPTKVLLSPEAKQALAKAIWSALKSPDGQPVEELVRAAEATGLPRNAILNAAKVARQREAAKRKQQKLQQQQQQQQVAYAQPPQAASASSNQYHPQQQQQQQQQQPLQKQRSYGSSRPTSSGVAHSLQSPSSAPPSTTQQQAKPSTASTISRTPSKNGSSNQSRPAPAPAPPVEVSWKRVQSGTFLIQKGRFLMLPNTCTAYSSTTSDCKTVSAATKSSPLAIVQQQQTASKVVSAATLQAAQSLRKRLLRRQGEAPKEVLLDPQKFRRVKVERKTHAKTLDRAARKVRQVTAETMLKSHKEWNKALLSHQSDFIKFHKSRKAEALKLAKACRDTLDKGEKQREKEAAAAERARLAALKSNDMTAYSKLLEETKNDRLKFLMEKTEESFTQISSLLHERGGGHGNTAAGSNEKKKESSSYYESAHFKAEEVRQPSILVGGDLKEYQMGGLQWLVSLYNNKLNGILADEMGLGKTIQAIALLAYLMEFKSDMGPYLVIVPLSTLSNWQNEFYKWLPSARLVCYKGTPGIRKEIYKEQVSKGHFNVLLTTYEYIIKDKKYLRKIDWTYAIVDEGHRMKNAQSKFAVCLGTHYNTSYRVLLTGTPLMNQLSELWALLNFLLPTVFNSVETFDQWFSKPFSQFGASSSGPNNEKENEADMLSNEERMLIIHRLHELLRPFMLRRVKSEVLDQLPEKVEKVLRCELSSWQKELYKQISFKAVQSNNLLGDSFVQQPATSRGLNNVVMQLRKVCNHPMLFSPEGYQINETIIRSSGKVALLDQMLPKLKAAGHRVLIFTQMTAVMTILEDYFAIRGYMSLRLDGSTPADEREKRMYKYNAPDSPYFIFLLSTRAGGLGLNLTSANTVIIFDSDWNPMMDLQAQDRAHRIGQRSDVSVFRLITNSPVEEKILSRATEKLNTAALVVEAGKFNKGSVESDNSLERKQLMEILLTDFDSSATQSAPKGPSEKSGSDNGDDEDDASAASDKEDLNELLSNNEIDYNLYAKFDEERISKGIPLAELYTSPDDVPDWIKYPGGKEKHDKIQQGLLDDFGDGNRKRKAVTYDDGLTEKQFLRLMDKQSIEEEKQKNARKKARKGTLADAEDDDDDGSNEQLAAGITGSELNDWTFRRLISCTKTVVTLKDPVTKRRIADLFLEKPAPQQFPDYYELIEKPVAINDILRKCRGKLYTTFSEFRNDWKLMVANATKFNGEGSWVVADAVLLEKELDRVLKRNGFTEDKMPSPNKKKPKKLRIKLSLKTVQPAAAADSSGDGEVPPELALAEPPKKKRGRKPKKKE